MSVTAGTPVELVQGVYATLAARCAAGRSRFGRPLTLTEKILLNHLDDPAAGDRARRQLQRLPPRPRGHAGRHRADGAAAVHDRRPARRRRCPRTVHCDHLIPAKVGARIDLGVAIDTNKEVYDFLRIGQRQVRHRLLGPRQRASSTRSCWRTTPSPAG